MRVLTGLILITIATATMGQNSRELHSRYGEPTLERFMARPGISLTVEYGSDRLACEVRIMPLRSLSEEEASQPAFQQGPGLRVLQSNRPVLMSSRDVSEITEEVAPVSVRGKEITSGSFQASCGVGNFSDYENVYILRGLSACAPDVYMQDTGTSITFKRDICPKHEPPTVIQK